MKHNLLRPLFNYKGEPFTREMPNPDGPAPIKVQMTLRDILEQACIMASPQKYSTSEKKVEVYRLLKKIAAAEPFAILVAEDVVLLKALVGDQMTVAAVGAVFEMLDNPKTDNEAPPLPQNS